MLINLTHLSPFRAQTSLIWSYVSKTTV